MFGSCSVAHAQFTDRARSVAYSSTILHVCVRLCWVLSADFMGTGNYHAQTTLGGLFVGPDHNQGDTKAILTCVQFSEVLYLRAGRPVGGKLVGRGNVFGAKSVGEKIVNSVVKNVLRHSRRSE